MLNQVVVTPHILVFDSGVGGLSIVAEIQQRMPSAHIIYASDNAAFPYGIKTEDELIARVNLVMQELVARYSIHIIVIACNTASTLSLPHLRQRFSLPIVGVVPAIKPATKLTKTGVIGLLATPATVARPYTHALIREHAQACTVISIGSSTLVYLAEQKLRGNYFSSVPIAEIAHQFINSTAGEKLDTLVLACTHFPLLRHEIAVHLPGVQLVDSGAAIARRVEFLSHQLQDLPASPMAMGSVAVFTQASNDVEPLRATLLKFGICQIDYLDVTP